MWENIQTEEKTEDKLRDLKINERSRENSPLPEKPADDEEQTADDDTKPKGQDKKIADNSADTDTRKKPESLKSNELFPRRSKSKLITTKPASWEIKEKEEEEKKKENRVRKEVREGLKDRTKESQDAKPVRRIGNKMAPGPNIRKI